MKTLEIIWNKFKKHIIYIAIICILISILIGSINKCSNVSNEYENNIAALNDTIKYYQDKNGNLVATKLAFESDLKTLKLLNENLYNEIKDLKAKTKVQQAVYFKGEINNPEQDTTYIIRHDTVSNGFSRTFEFNNEFRTLEGKVDYHKDSLGVAITKDQIQFDYTVALDKNNNIYIKSTNPYVKYSEISGFTLPKEKQKHWSLGIFGNYNYSPTDNLKYLDIGLGLNYNIGKFTIGPQLYVEKDFKENKKYFFIGGSLNWNILEW